MTELPPAGWYSNPNGAPGQRYFDGRDWTPYHRAAPPGSDSDAAAALPGQCVLSTDDRMFVLQRELASRTAVGWRVELLTPTSATIVRYPPRSNHALHFVLSVLTCGLWLPVWLLIAIIDGSRSVHRHIIMVDQHGQAVWDRR
jgi:hypothetical protein